MNESHRTYQRELALFCLQANSKPATAGDLAELMGTTAQHEGHDPSAWRRINAQNVAGVLRSLEMLGLVHKEGSAYNSKRGRDEPKWRVVPAPRRRLPDPPSAANDDEPAPATTVPFLVEPRPEDMRDYEKMSREQLLAVLWSHDELIVSMVRFLETNVAALRELEGARSRARQYLRQAGLEA